jgi:hypothetical protein
MMWGYLVLVLASVSAASSESDSEIYDVKVRAAVHIEPLTPVVLARYVAVCECDPTTDNPQIFTKFHMAFS